MVSRIRFVAPMREKMMLRQGRLMWKSNEFCRLLRCRGGKEVGGSVEYIDGNDSILLIPGADQDGGDGGKVLTGLT